MRATERYERAWNAFQIHLNHNPKASLIPFLKERHHGKMSDGVAYSTLYGHMRSVATSAGKYVKQGEIIGYVGSTGNSTGNHLHLEVWRGGSKANAVNPRGYIPMR